MTVQLDEKTQLRHLKGELHSILFKPLEYNYSERHKANLRIFTKADATMLRPLLTGEVQQERFEDLFDLLFDAHYEDVVDICLSNTEKMKDKKNSLTLLVRSEGVDILFVVYDDRERANAFSLIPLNVMNKCKFMKSDYTINVQTNEVNQGGVYADEDCIA